MRSPLALVIAAALASAAHTPAARAAEMWGKVESGMTWDQVAEMYPATKGTKHKPGKQIEIKDVPILDGCKAEANIMFKADRVDAVILKGNPAVKSKCADQVLAGLSAKYGEALSREETATDLLAREGRVYIWNRLGTIMRFKRFTDGAYGGGDLMRASWELTYSTAAADIAL